MWSMKRGDVRALIDDAFDDHVPPFIAHAPTDDHVPPCFQPTHKR